jgi:hypothetical protein
MITSTNVPSASSTTITATTTTAADLMICRGRSAGLMRDGCLPS